MGSEKYLFRNTINTKPGNPRANNQPKGLGRTSSKGENIRSLLIKRLFSSSLKAINSFVFRIIFSIILSEFDAIYVKACLRQKLLTSYIDNCCPTFFSVSLVYPANISGGLLYETKAGEN